MCVQGDTSGGVGDFKLHALPLNLLQTPWMSEDISANSLFHSHVLSSYREGEREAMD